MDFERANVGADGSADQLAIEIILHVSRTPEYDNNVLENALHKLGYIQENTDDDEPDDRTSNLVGYEDKQDEPEQLEESRRLSEYEGMC